MIKLLIKCALLMTMAPTMVFSQTDTVNTSVLALPPKEDNPLKFNLNESGSHWFQGTFLNQTWIRYNESMPGTKLNGANAPETFDIGLRRTRIQMFGQISDHTFLYFQFGMNNVNAQAALAGTNNRKIQAFFHDAVGEYKVFKANNWLKIGAGLTITNGLSRFSQPSIGTIATLDVPVFLQATVDQTDEFSRKLSVYARGQIGKIDYRFSLSDPYPIGNSGSATPTKLPTSASFAWVGHHKQYQTYLMYQFFEHENHTTPYMTGTYLGRKRILNIASGIIYQKDATWYNSSLTGGNDTTYNDMVLWSVESFYDAPIHKAKGTALNLFAGFYSMNYGKQYLRYSGQMNPVGSNTGGTSLNGAAGNAYPMFGSGNSFYAQAAYLFKRNLLGEKGTLQPFASFRAANYQALNAPLNVYDLGINWLIDGHRSKLSLDYQLIPVYAATDKTVSERKSAVILQYQINL